MSYSLKDYEYRFKEFRDLIEFKLNYTPNQLENILLHFYELKDISQKYYFISDNCTTELVKLLDMADENYNLASKLNYEVIPLDIIILFKEKNLISDITKYSSKYKKFYFYYNQLTKNEIQIFHDIIDYKLPVNDLKKLDTISNETKINLLNTIILYIDIKSIRQELNMKKYIYPYMKLVQLKRELSTQGLELKEKLEELPYSNKFSKLYMTSNFNNIKDYSTIGYRHLYRSRKDLMDTDKRNGSINVLDFALRYDEEKNTRLDHFTFFDLEALPYSDQYFSEYTRKMRLSIDRIFLDDNLYSNFKYALGKRYYDSNHIGYLFEIPIGVNYYDKMVYNSGLNIEIEKNNSNKVLFDAALSHNIYTNDKRQTTFNVSTHYKILDNTLFELSYEKKKEKDTKLNTTIEQNSTIVKLNIFF